MGLVHDRVYLGAMKRSAIRGDGSSAPVLIKTHYNYVPSKDRVNLLRLEKDRSFGVLPTLHWPGAVHRGQVCISGPWSPSSPAWLCTEAKPFS